MAELERDTNLEPTGPHYWNPSTQTWQKWEGSIGVKPSSYDADLTMDGTAQSVALASGAKQIIVQNRGDINEAIRVAFGTSAANAEANLTISAAAATTGHWIGSASGGYESKQVLGVPANATHYAIANAVAGDTQTVSVIQGV